MVHYILTNFEQMSLFSSKCTSDSVCKLPLSDVLFYVSPYQKCFCEPLTLFKLFGFIAKEVISFASSWM